MTSEGTCDVTELAVSCSEVLAVAAQDGNQVHLRAADVGMAADDHAGETLCGLPAAGARSIVAYFAVGCLPCARLALDAGVRRAVDRRHAAIDLDRFLRSRHP